MRHASFVPSIALSFALALSGPAFAQTATTDTEDAQTPVEYDASTVLAKVNDREITVGHMVALMERLPEQYQTLPDEQLYSGILDQLIDQALIADSISPSSETDTKRVQLILENERLALLSKSAIDALIADGADPVLLEQSYAQQYGNIEPKTEYNASHILVETAEDAQDVLQMINDGGEFADVAKEKSTGPSGPNGGELGWFGDGVMVPEFQAAVLEMEAGAVSEPVQTQFGWHVIKLNETREVPPPTLDEVSEELSQAIIQDQIEAAIADIRSRTTIERFELDIPQSVIREGELIDQPE